LQNKGVASSIPGIPILLLKHPPLVLLIMAFFPHLAARDPLEDHRTSTPLELLFDLVTVIAVAAITAGLHHEISHGHGLQALPRFAFLFAAVWWAWMNFTWFASAFDRDDALYRILTMVVMAGALVFAGGAGFIFRTMDFSWGLGGWAVMRLGMAALWLRASGDPRHRQTALRYALGIVIAQLGWTLLYFTTTPGSSAFFLFGFGCFLLEFAVPMVAEKAGATPWHRHHIMERYGLLTIIVLGEVLLSVSLGFGKMFGDHPAPAAAVCAASGIIIVFCLWWLYFAETNHLTDRRYSRAFLWGYGHVFFFAAAAMLGAGLAAEGDVADHHSAVGHRVTAWFVGGPLALALATLWFVRDRFHPLGNRALALPVMAVICLGGAVLGFQAWGFALVITFCVIWRIPFTNFKMSPPTAQPH